MSSAPASIKLLPQTLTTHLDSLAIVPNPFAIVQALVENSLDADAETIIVQILRDKLIVVDDGSGIQQDSMEMLGVKYASSKSGGTCDGTLGFRGVALAAIKSSCMVELVTVRSRPILTGGAREELGWEVQLVAEKRRYLVEVAMKGGSVVEVALVPNISARELVKAVMAWAERLACVWPRVNFEVWEGKRLAWCVKDSVMAERVARVFGVRSDEVMTGRAQVHGSNASVEVVVGRSSNNLKARKRERHIIVGVNGRVVKREGWDEMTDAIMQEMGVCSVDGSRRLPLFARVCTCHDHVAFGVPDICDTRHVEIDTTVVQNPRALDEPELGIGVIFGKLRNAHTYENAVRCALERALTLEKSGHRFGLAKSQSAVRSLSMLASEYYKLPTKTKDGRYIGTDWGDHPGNRGHLSRAEGLTSMSVVAQVLNTYIVVEKEGGIMLLEQHTSDERVKYEYLLERWTSDMESLDRPLRLPGLLGDEELSNLDSLGCEVHEHSRNDNGGPATTYYTLSKVPSLLKNVEGQELRTHILTVAKFSDPESAAAAIACRLAVKNGRILRMSEMTRIVRGLSRCRAPHVCPHGRPISMELGKNELASAFKRTWAIQRNVKRNLKATTPPFPLPRRGVVT